MVGSDWERQRRVDRMRSGWLPGDSARDERPSDNPDGADRRRMLERAAVNRGAAERLAATMAAWFEALSRPSSALAVFCTWTGRDLRRPRANGCAHPYLDYLVLALSVHVPVASAGFVAGEFGRRGVRGVCDHCNGNAHLHGMLWLERGAADAMHASWAQAVGFAKLTWGDIEEVALAYASKYIAKDHRLERVSGLTYWGRGFDWG